jgi:5-methyltetrahydrofolate--homocysteine methyltransferase
VLDASRVIGVVSQLLNPESKPKFVAETRGKQEKQRVEFADRKGARKLLPLAEARRRAQPTDWKTVDIPKPEFTGTRVFSTEAGVSAQPGEGLKPTAFPLTLEEIAAYIDWGPFFSTWELQAVSRKSSRIPWSAKKPPSFMARRRRCCSASSGKSSTPRRP